MGKAIDTRTTVRTPVELARRALDDHVVEVFQGRHRAGQPRRSFDMSVAVDLGHGTVVAQAVTMHAGRVRDRDDGGVAMHVRWEPQRAHLLPSFEGELRVLPADGRRTLELDGAYEIPLGGLGRLGDAAAGHVVAQRSLDRLVVGLGHHLDRVVDAFKPQGGMRAAPETADLRERPRTRAP